jgi:hypothetical protein
MMIFIRPNLHRRQDPIPHTRHLPPPMHKILAYLYKTADPCPHAVIRQLSPATSMRYVPLVEDAAEEIYQDGDDADDGEDGAGADALFCGLGSDAGVFGEDFEVVGAFVWGGADEG